MNALVELAPFDSASFSHPLPDDAPIFCPIDGRQLEYAYWDTVSGERRYSAFVCFGWSRFVWLRKLPLFKTPWASGMHYRYEFGPYPTPGPARHFDPLTGERKGATK